MINFTKISIFAAAVIALNFTACKIAGDGPQDLPADKPAMQENVVQSKPISEGSLLGDGQEGIAGPNEVIIQTEAQWEALYTKMNSVNPTQKEVSIDFEQRTILAYFDQIRPLGGYAVEIVKVTEINEIITARVKFTIPEGNSIDIMTQPYSIVSIPKTKKLIKFVAIIE